jgi:hypothetical protein
MQLSFDRNAVQAYFRPSMYAIDENIGSGIS